MTAAVEDSRSIIGVPKDLCYNIVDYAIDLGLLFSVQHSNIWPAQEKVKFDEPRRSRYVSCGLCESLVTVVTWDHVAWFDSD